MELIKRTLTGILGIILLMVSNQVQAVEMPSDSVNWEGLDLTGTYYKQHIRTSIPAWPFFTAAAIGAGVGGYALFKKEDIPELQARNDTATADCKTSLYINVLENDDGAGLTIRSFINMPDYLQPVITQDGIVRIDDVGNQPFNFTYIVQDKSDASDSARVTVRVITEEIQAIDDEYFADIGEQISGNLLDNDIGSELEVVDYVISDGSNISIESDGSFNLEPEEGRCRDYKFYYVIQDKCALSDTADVSIDILDEEPPVAECPSTSTFSCEEDIEPDNTGYPIVTDNCDNEFDYSYKDSVVPGNCANERDITRNWTIADASGNETTCTQTIKIADEIAPELVCPKDITIECGDDLDPSFTGFAEVTDNCSPLEELVIEYKDNIQNTCAMAGTITRTWSATDACGNEAKCEQIITVVDNLSPEITCPANITVGCDRGVDPSVTGELVAFDNCTPAAALDISYTDQVDGNISCIGRGVVTRLWVATDLCGNTSSCTQIIEVEPIAGPQVTCPANITISCGDDFSPESTGYPTASSDCSKPGEIEVKYEDNTAGLGSCNETGVLVRNWTVTDPCGVSSTCLQIITVVDNSAPLLVCPEDVTTTCDASTNPSVTGRATATDNCTPENGISITYKDVREGPGNCTGTTTIIRTWTAIDGCGNESVCDQTIIKNVIDAPEITCPEDATIECTESINPSNTGTATASTNCTIDGEVDISYSDDDSNLNNCGGYILRTWRALDPCGLESTCTQKIFFEDNNAPVLSGIPNDITLSCDQSLPSIPNVSSNDNCDDEPSIDFEETTIAGSCPNSYTIIRTWSTMDACGNTSSASQEISVIDNTTPLLNCPSDVITTCDADTDPSITGFAVATDNCSDAGNISLAYSDQINGPNDCSGTTTISRTWTAIDECGNTISCIQEIVKEQLDGPDIKCPKDISISCDESTDPANTGYATAKTDCSFPGEIQISYTDDNANLDNCGGFITRTWRAEDPCGLVSTCMQRINFEDDTDPQLSGIPSDITISCNVSPPNPPQVFATDNCDPDPTIEFEESTLSGSCQGEFSIERTWTATDECGNSTSRTQTIYVFDIEAPAISCPANFTTTCDADADPATTGFPTTVDNCSPVEMIAIDYSDVQSGPGDCSGVTTITRTWTAMDDCGNESSCVQVITLNPVGGPTIDCPPDITIACDASRAPGNTGRPTVTTDCSLPGDISVSYSNNSSNLDDCGGYLLRTWRAEDACGLISTCEQRITTVDTETPVLSGVPEDVSIGCNDAIPNPPGVTAEDNCDDNPNIVFEETVNPGACDTDYTITRTWTATDACGNSISQEQTIEIVDEAPVISCPADVTVSCGESIAPEDTGFPTATDDCSTPAQMVYEYSDNNDGLTDCSSTGFIERLWIAKDACGNTASCIQTIIIEDNEAPTLQNCPSDQVVFCIGGIPGPANVSAVDLCDTNPTLIYEEDISGSCPSDHLITRTWTAIDACNNSDFCDQVILVIGNTGLEVVDENTEVEPPAGQVLIGLGSIDYMFKENTSVRLNLTNSGTYSAGTFVMPAGLNAGRSSGFSGELSVRRYFSFKSVRPFVGAGIAFYKGNGPSTYANDSTRSLGLRPTTVASDLHTVYLTGGVAMQWKNRLWFELSGYLGGYNLLNDKENRFIRPWLNTSVFFLIQNSNKSK